MLVLTVRRWKSIWKLLGFRWPHKFYERKLWIKYEFEVYISIELLTQLCKYYVQTWLFLFHCYTLFLYVYPVHSSWLSLTLLPIHTYTFGFPSTSSWDFMISSEKPFHPSNKVEKKREKYANKNRIKFAVLVWLRVTLRFIFFQRAHTKNGLGSMLCDKITLSNFSVNRTRTYECEWSEHHIRIAQGSKLYSHWITSKKWFYFVS